MYQRLSAVLFPIVTLLLLGTVFWGYQEHQEKNNILVKAENQYQRAFHDLSFHMDQLHEELGNTLAVSSTSNFHRKGLINMWRLTSQAQSEVNQLPLSLMPFHETEQLLANVASFSYRTAMRDLKKQPLSDKELKLLNALYKHSKEIKSDLRKVQETVLNKSLRWMDVETALASGDENFDNDIIDGFKLMNKRVGEYGDIEWGPTVMTMNRRFSAKSLTGPMVTAEDVKRKAAEFLNLNDTGNMKVTENGANTDFPTYSVTIAKNGNEGAVQLDYTKKGGKLVYYLGERPVQKKKLSIDQASGMAERFLNEHGYPDMRAIGYDEYENVASITFAKVRDGVTIYTEKLAVNVALDNGEVTGLSAGDMLQADGNRKIGKPAMKEGQARAMLNGSFKVTGQSLAIIRNDMDEEVLCYEYLGTINGGEYRIYLNAETGIEEKIEHLRDADAEVNRADDQPGK
ncbi:germination protein YpeB [Paenibacillus alkalitolerans]|uniref:germination protein YpeB n=1 Tax=Paenibacillus alkalitolerans TaxID=2799335 RepID=UPI0018F497A6|nr:germination protein YpeB [Paenibacillus alkalitolerans]